MTTRRPPSAIPLLAALLAASAALMSGSEAFAPAFGRISPTGRRADPARTVPFMSDGEDADTRQPSLSTPSKAKSFDESTKSIEDEEAAAAMERTAGMDAEEEAAFNARASEFSSMKDKIRARAAEMNIEKSVATAEAIKAAEKRARLQQSAEPTLDMSVFSDPEKNPIMYNPEDELTDEEIAEIDPTGQKPFLEQALDEFKATVFPGPLDVAKTVGFMFVTFAVSATFILKSDEFLRGLYTEWGFIPGPDAQLDYSDLELPAGWDEDLDGLTGSLAEIVETAKKAQP